MEGPAAENWRMLMESLPAGKWQLRVALQLLRERMQGPASPWRHYIELLPAEHEACPLFFSRHHIQGLQNPELQRLVARRCADLTSLADLINESSEGRALFDGDRVSADWLGWSLATVASRTELGTSFRRLVPFVDICNHAWGGRNTAFLQVEPALAGDSSRVFADAGAALAEPQIVLKAARDISSGEQITLSYAQRPNEHYLMNYGMIPSEGAGHNPSDIVRLPLAFDLYTKAAEVCLPSESPGLAWQDEAKRDLLARHKLMNPWLQHQRRAELQAQLEVEQLLGLDDTSAAMVPFFAFRRGWDVREVVDPELLGMLRIMLSTPAYLDEQKDQPKGFWTAPLAEPKDLAVAEFVLVIAKLMVRVYPTTLSEDKRLLLQEADPAMRAVLRYRIGKKQLLDQVCSLVDGFIDDQTNQAKRHANQRQLAAEHAQKKLLQDQQRVAEEEARKNAFREREKLNENDQK